MFTYVELSAAVFIIRSHSRVMGFIKWIDKAEHEIVFLYILVIVNYVDHVLSGSLCFRQVSCVIEMKEFTYCLCDGIGCAERVIIVLHVCFYLGQVVFKIGV